MKKHSITLLSAALALLTLGGCDSGSSQASAEQTKAFDGGPMPDAAKQRMAEGLAKANQGAADAAAKARAKAQGGG
jgi:hypothetical protein